MNKLRLLAAALLGLTASTVMADVTLSSTTHYQSIVDKVAKLDQQYGTDQVLIVLDIDNTILTSTQDLGSDTWYLWQRGKLPLKPTQEQTVDCLFEDSIGLLYELVPMTTTEPQLPKQVKQWQQNHSLIALSSRAPKYRAATERELTRNGFSLSTAALKPTGSDQAPVLRTAMQGREVSYMNGIMLTQGLNKGDMLKYILQTYDTKQRFKTVVFVDDSEKNIHNLSAAYQNSKINLELVHYTKIEHDRITENGAVVTPKQAQKMTADWTTLNATLNKLFPARAAGCLVP